LPCHSSGADQPGSEVASGELLMKAERERMVREQIEARQVTDERVLRAMLEVPRHHFVPPHLQDQAYDDSPLPIGNGQTISQPYIVALMTELLELREGARVLEIGTGCGYQAAILAALKAEVYSVEIVESLSIAASRRLRNLGYEVTCKVGDGHQGWLEHSPYDGILVAAAPSRIPPALVEQLAIGGRLVLPVGDVDQQLTLMHRQEEGVHREELIPVRFVPMVGTPDWVH